MLLKLTYFITNIFFVASLISTLFAHRFITQLKGSEKRSENEVKLKKAQLIRTLLYVVTAIFFLIMCASFLLDMYTNG